MKKNGEREEGGVGWVGEVGVRKERDRKVFPYMRRFYMSSFPTGEDYQRVNGKRRGSKIKEKEGRKNGRQVIAMPSNSRET